MVFRSLYVDVISCHDYSTGNLCYMMYTKTTGNNNQITF